MMANTQMKPEEQRLDRLVDSWFTQTPAVSREDIDALQVESANDTGDASRDRDEQ